MASNVLSAEAYNPAQRAAQRPRAGYANWAPDHVSLTSTYWMEDPGQGAPHIRHNVFDVSFYWDRPPHVFELDGSEQIFEFNITIPCDSNGKAPWGKWRIPGSVYDAASGTITDGYGYDPYAWSTNIPNAAHPYEDVMYSDTCSGDNQVKLGMGVGDVSKLVQGTEYHTTFGTIGDYGADPNWYPEVKVNVQTGTNYDASDPSGAAHFVPWLDKTCSYNTAATGEWNDTSPAAFKHRLKAAWCGWIDYTRRVVEPGSSTPFFVGQDQTYQADLNLLPQPTGYDNDGLMERTDQNPDNSSWFFQGFGGSVSTVCSGAYEQSCFMRLAGGTGTSYLSHVQSLAQDVGDQLSLEAELRCPDNSAGYCNIGMQIWGYDVPYSGQNELKEIRDVHIPDNNQWHHCRIDNGGYDNGVGTDAEHGPSHQSATSTHGANDFKWHYPHSHVHVDINITAPWSLDVDNVMLGGRSQEEDPDDPVGQSVDGVGEVSSTPICTAGTF